MAITLNISGEVDGIFTLEDDGTPGNGMSVLRRPNGTIFSTFAHPGDAFTILSRPGQTINIALVDVFSSTFTIGSLTDPTVRPSAILVDNIVSTLTTTLTAAATIAELGNDTTADITASFLALDAGQGIGAFNPIETSVSRIEAESVVGGINLVNNAALRIGGVTPELRGLFTGTSGNITLVAQGTITVSEQDGAESVHSAGNLTLNAVGATANIFSFLDGDMLFALGNIYLSAGQDVLIGANGGSFEADVSAGGGIFVNAGRDFIIDGSSVMAADDQGLGTGGGISIIAGERIIIGDSFGPNTSLAITPLLGSGSILLQTGAGGTFALFGDTDNAILVRSSGDVTIRADRVLIDDDTGINMIGGGTVTLTTASPGRGINLGVDTDGLLAMELSDTELDRIVGPNVVIGSPEAGPIFVNGVINHLNENLTLRTGNDLVINASIITPSTLTLVSAESILQNSGSVLITGILTVSVDSPDLDPAGGILEFEGSVDQGDVVLSGNTDDDTLEGTSRRDIISGLAGNDLILGRGGDDTLDGGIGADRMGGGPGNDFFFVDNAGDIALDATGEGAMDRIFASVSHTMFAGTEIEILSTIDNLATTPINLSGNALKQFIFGNAGANSLDSRGGGDVMSGFGGDDFYFVRSTTDRAVETAGNGNDRVFASATFALEAGSHVEILSTIDNLATTAISLTGNALPQFIFGNAGANSLDSGGGGDTMMGFGGNDFYFVRSSGDRAVEAAAGGTGDRVFAAASFTLEAGSEVEILSTIDNLATTAINLTGNALTQFIFGNAGANSLDSGGGNDVMSGFGGDDFYFIRSVGDRAVEAAAAGNDRVFAAVSFTLEPGSHVEMITTIDNLATTAINLTGNELANTIFGNAGANVLDGKGAADTLVGLEGADTFAFTTALGGGNVDNVSGFAAGLDDIALDDAVFTGLAPGALPAGAFRTGTMALDADDRIIYDPASGAIYFDADGVGGTAAVHFATANTGLALGASDFVVI